MIEHKLIRCEADDPNRCQSSGKGGQCPYTAMENSKFCQRHDGCGAKARENDKTNMYRLQVWQARLSEFSEHDSIKSLRNEIGILRILLEETMNKCRDTTALLLYSNKISDLCLRIEKLVSSCNRLELKMGLLLDKASALNFAGQVVEIISLHISDPVVIDAISNDIISALASLTGNQNDL
jgi:hypothetical protein